MNGNVKTIQTFVSMFGVLLVGIISSIVISRGLTPVDRGVYLGITMWNGLVLGLADLGIYISTVYLLGKCKIDKERNDIFTTLFLWAVVTGVVAVAIAFAVTGWMLTNLSPWEKWAAYFFFLSIIGGPVTTMLSGVMASEENFNLINLVRIGLPLTITVLWISYFLLGFISVALCLFTTAVVSLLAIIPYVWGTRQYFRSRGRFRRDIFKQGFWYGIKSYGGSIINVLGNNGTQIILYTLTPAALAFYQTAHSTTGVLWSIPRAVGDTSLPKLIHEKQELLHGKVCQILRLTVMSTLVAGVGLVVAVPVMIPLLFGKAYMPAVIPALLLLPGAFFGGMTYVLANALNSIGKTFHTTVATGAHVAVSLTTMLFAIHPWGIEGVAVSVVLGFIVNFLVRLVWYNRVLQPIKFREGVPGVSDFRTLLRIGTGILQKVNVKLKKNTLGGSL